MPNSDVEEIDVIASLGKVRFQQAAIIEAANLERGLSRWRLRDWPSTTVYPALCRTVVELNGYSSGREIRIEAILEVGKSRCAMSPIEEFSDGKEQTGLSAPVFAIDKQVATITKLEIVDSWTWESSEI
jgi:hypothetical protein